jgi:Uma2 family endonuclease
LYSAQESNVALAHERLTLEEFLKLPEEKPALEYFDGVIEQKMSPKTRHSALQGELVERINTAARPTQIARAFPELRATFGGESPVPDLSVYRWERIPRDEQGRLVDEVRIPPDITVEIVSPGQSTNQLVRRCRWYVSNGVHVALLLDPEDRSVLAFLSDGTMRAWTDQDRIDLSPVIPKFDLTVEQLYSTLNG